MTYEFSDAQSVDDGQHAFVGARDGFVDAIGDDDDGEYDDDDDADDDNNNNNKTTHRHSHQTLGQTACCRATTGH